MVGGMYIDLGNSRLKWAVDQGKSLSPMQVLEYPGNKLYEQLIPAWKTLTPAENIWVASVASELAFVQLTDWLAEHWKLAPRIMEVSPPDCGLTCGYRQPRQLGVDRWAAMIAAFAACPDGVCVVDCGTAVTLDVVNGQGQHLGGYILPGINTMQQTVLRETAINMDAMPSAVALEWGDSTASCIQLGTRKSIVALIEQTIERMQARGICDPGLVLTGGQMELIKPLLQIDHQHREALVLEGIKLYAQEQSR